MALALNNPRRLICYLKKYIRGAFNKFPDVFVQASKIVVDSWKFSILLLYILWNDWPISGSNEQLQQEFEYTLLKPNSHSWGISKTETYGMLLTAFRPSCMNRASVFEWHKRFKEGRESVRDDEKCGKSKGVNTPRLIGQNVRVRVTMLRFKGVQEEIPSEEASTLQIGSKPVYIYIYIYVYIYIYIYIYIWK